MFMAQGMAQGMAQNGPKNEEEQEQQAKSIQSNVSRGLFGGFGGVIRTVKHAVNNAKPPYLNNSSNGESIEGNKTYTITKV